MKEKENNNKKELTQEESNKLKADSIARLQLVDAQSLQDRKARITSVLTLEDGITLDKHVDDLSNDQVKAGIIDVIFDKAKGENGLILMEFLLPTSLQTVKDNADRLNNLSDDELRKVIGSYIDEFINMGSEGIKILKTMLKGESNKGNTNTVDKLARDILRAETSFTEPGKALENFKGLNKSNFDVEAKTYNDYLGTSTLSVLNSKKEELNYHERFFPTYVAGILNTDLGEAVCKVDNKDDREKIAYLAAGIIAKIAGKDGPYSPKEINGMVTPPREIILAAQSAAVRIYNKNPKLKDMQPDKLMELGKAVGKEVREDLSELQKKDHMKFKDGGENNKGNEDIVNTLSYKISVAKVINAPERKSFVDKLASKKEPLNDKQVVDQLMKKGSVSTESQTSKAEGVKIEVDGKKHTVTITYPGSEKDTVNTVHESTTSFLNKFPKGTTFENPALQALQRQSKGR